MSDTDSISSFGTLCSTTSVCEEIEQLLNNCHILHAEIQNSNDTLDNIEYLIASQNNIQVTYNGQVSDLDEVLESLHSIALKNIKETGISNFSQLLLQILE